MNEARLREMLRAAPVPGAEEAERRGLALATAAFAEREPAPGRRRASSPRRLALAIVVAVLTAGLLLSLASASVRHWVGDVFSAEVPKAHPGLAEIPGGGRLLVQSARGPWVVRPDGSRRLLGDYREATWSPNGLFVAVAAGRTLSAVEPDGTPRWSIAAPARVTMPRWWPGRFRIAYRSGDQLRVTAADGTEDHAIARGTAPVAPAWSPLGLPELAYIEGGGGRPPRLVIANGENGERLGSAPALAGIEKLEWGHRGTVLLEASPSAVRLRALRIGKLTPRVGTEPAYRSALPPAGATVVDAALAPRGGRIAVLVRSGHGDRVRSSVLVSGRKRGHHRLLSVPGRLSELAFSPDGRRLLVAWPEADEWFFLSLGRSHGKAVGNVAAAFAPGQRAAAFPRVEGWCCSAPPGG